MSTWPCMPILTPYQATAAQGTLRSAVGAVGNFYDKAKTGDCLGAAPIFNVREVISSFTKMLKPWRGQEKYPFFLKMRQWWLPQHKEGVRKSVFPCLGVSFSCVKDA